LEILAKLCWEGEQGWWVWHETLQKNIFAYFVIGLLSSDLMFGNPAAGAISVKGI